MSRDPIDDPALAPLLRALEAPASEHELDGLDGAVRSFRAAHLTSSPPSSRRDALTAWQLLLVTTKRSTRQANGAGCSKPRMAAGSGGVWTGISPWPLGMLKSIPPTPR